MVMAGGGVNMKLICRLKQHSFFNLGTLSNLEGTLDKHLAGYIWMWFGLQSRAAPRIVGPLFCCLDSVLPYSKTWVIFVASVQYFNLNYLSEFYTPAFLSLREAWSFRYRDLRIVNTYAWIHATADSSVARSAVAQISPISTAAGAEAPWPPKRDIRRCPATILAASRTANATGRTNNLTVSITTISGTRAPGVPSGTRWAILWLNCITSL